MAMLGMEAMGVAPKVAAMAAAAIATTTMAATSARAARPIPKVHKAPTAGAADGRSPAPTACSTPSPMTTVAAAKDGRLIDYTVDAQTGAILSEEGR